MDERDGRELQEEARTALLLRREALRRQSAINANTSPPAIEATLASISAEVMEEAIARRSKSPRNG